MGVRYENEIQARFPKIVSFLFLCLFIITPSKIYAESFSASGFGGSTGLISTPTAKVGWNTDLAIDFSYHYIDDDERESFIPGISFTLFKRVELGITFDLQDERGDDIILHGKFNFYHAGSSALAIGGNYQNIKYMEAGDSETYSQLYLAATYSGNFLSMPALTTIVFGKTWGDYVPDENMDFSMGFDLILLPELFKGYIHWINDFANYSYSIQPTGTNSYERGCFNTGIRIVLLKDSRFKMNVDVILTDFFDESGRSLALGASFGIPIS
jgi:hypothetical protein